MGVVLGTILGSINVLFDRWRPIVRPKTCEWCQSSGPLDSRHVEIIEKHYLVIKYSLNNVNDIIRCSGWSFVKRKNEQCKSWRGPRGEITPYYPPVSEKSKKNSILQYL